MGRTQPADWEDWSGNMAGLWYKQRMLKLNSLGLEYTKGEAPRRYHVQGDKLTISSCIQRGGVLTCTLQLSAGNDCSSSVHRASGSRVTPQRNFALKERRHQLEILTSIN